jgi:hypothetical protein
LVKSAIGEDFVVGANDGEGFLKKPEVNLLQDLVTGLPNFMDIYKPMTTSKIDPSMFTSSKPAINVQFNSLIKNAQVNTDYDLVNGVKNNLKPITEMVSNAILKAKH